ncbi:c-type cytochrome, partial [Hydrogenophaga sp.]
SAPAPVAAVAAAPAPAAENAVGKKVYGSVCSMCHAANVAGAPKPGDKADWGPRIAQGKDTLYKHAVEGFTGAKGMMPPRGGGNALTDDELKAAVDYMVAQSL